MNLNDVLNDMSYKDGTNYLINLLGDDGVKTILSDILIPRIEKERDITFKSFRVHRWHVSKDRIRDYKTGNIDTCRIRVFYSGDYIKGQSWTNDIDYKYHSTSGSISSRIDRSRDLYKGIESEVTVSISEFITAQRNYLLDSIIS